MEMEYLYEQGGEPPHSPPPPYSSFPRQTQASCPQSLRAPRRRQAVAVYIPSGAPPKYSCEKSPGTEVPRLTSRRSFVSSEATLSDAAVLSDIRATKIDKIDKIDQFHTVHATTKTVLARSGTTGSGATLFEDAHSSISDAKVAGVTHDDEDDGSGQSPALSVTARRYEILLNAHRSIILAYRTANETLEHELLRSRQLEIRTEELRKVVEEKDRQIAAREARVKALETQIREGPRTEEAEEKSQEIDGEKRERSVKMTKGSPPAVYDLWELWIWEIVEVTLPVVASVALMVFAIAYPFLAIFNRAVPRAQ